MEAISAAGYCHLAEECFFLAAVSKDREAAAQLVNAGDDFPLRRQMARRSADYAIRS